MTDRKQELLSMLSENRDISVAEMAKSLGVSVVTVRSDLAALEEDGLIVKTFGGALPAFHPQIIERRKNSSDLKNAVAKKAAEQIEDGDTVIISAGTTTALIAKYLLGKRDVHIVTNNTLLLTYARVNPQLRVTLIGGEFRASEEGVVGPLAMKALEQFYVNKAFIGVDGISVKQGFTAHLVESAELVRTMADQADNVFAVADSGKVGKPGFAKILPLSDVTALITGNMKKNREAELKEAGLKTIITTK